MLNAFTVDVEDYFQVSAFDQLIDREHWDKYESRVVKNTETILTLLDRHRVRGTFFVLGWIAERYPSLVRSIEDAGHEIGSHSYWHRLIYTQTPAQFREDLQQSIAILQSVASKPVEAFRAPSFSITKESLWALDILAEQGIKYDSSIFPVYHDRYGIPDARPEIHQITTDDGDVWEFPPSVVKAGPINLPVSGGGYFRLYPWRFTATCLASINRKCRRPFMFYMHPWEIDANQPRLPIRSRGARFRHYVNLSSTYAKLDLLLRKFQFGPISDVIQQSAMRVSAA